MAAAVHYLRADIAHEGSPITLEGEAFSYFHLALAALDQAEMFLRLASTKSEQSHALLRNAL